MIPRKKPPMLVREPVQVYLDGPDLSLLGTLAQSTGLSKAELLRRGLRRLASDALTERQPGWSLDLLIGSLDTGDELPADLSERHDDYLNRFLEERRTPPRRKTRGPRVR